MDVVDHINSMTEIWMYIQLVYLIKYAILLSTKDHFIEIKLLFRVLKPTNRKRYWGLINCATISSCDKVELSIHANAMAAANTAIYLFRA